MTVVSIRMPDERIQALDRAAEADGLGRSEYLRTLLEKHLARSGVWVVRFYDGVVVAIYDSEIEALRMLASGQGQEVAFWPWGEREAP